MATLYKIANWNTVYESHETRKLECLRYVYLPNKHDGLGFRRVSAQRNACELFAAWILLVEIASKGRKGQRGILSRDGVPLDPTECALMTGFPADAFKRAFSFFVQPQMGWLEAEEIETPNEMLPGFIGNLPESPADLPLSPGNLPPSPADLPQTSPGIEGIERKKEGKRGAASPILLPFESEEFRSAWTDWKRHRTEIRAPLKETSEKQTLSALERIGEKRAIAMIRFTIFKGWRGLREPSGEDMKQFQATPGQTSSQPIREPQGWKSFLNHEYPESRFSAGQVDEVHEWSELDRTTQSWLVGEMRKKGQL